MSSGSASAIAAALSIAGCSSETVTAPPPAPVNWTSLRATPAVDAGADIVTAKERALAGAYASGLTSAGFGQLGSILDEDAHFASPGMDDAHGRGPVVRAHELLLGAFEGRKVVLTRIWRTPSEQTLEWTLTGTQEHDWLGVPTTHKPIVLAGVSLIWTKDDGSVTDVHVYLDTSVAKAQLGVGPKELLALPVPSVPSGSPQNFDQTGSAQESDGIGTVKAALDALEGNKEAEYLAAMSDDVEVSVPERGAPARGKADAKAYFRSFRKAIGQLDTTVLNAWGVGPFAIVEYSVTGEQVGPIGWIPLLRDRVIRFEIVDVCEIANGKIARVRRYDNPVETMGGTPGL